MIVRRREENYLIMKVILLMLMGNGLKRHCQKEEAFGIPLDEGCGLAALEGGYSSGELFGYFSANGKVSNKLILKDQCWFMLVGNGLKRHCQKEEASGKPLDEGCGLAAS